MRASSVLLSTMTNRAVRMAWAVCGMLLLICELLPAATEQGLAKNESVKPGINAQYLAPDMQVEEWVERFEGESREIFVVRHAIVEAVQLKPGMAVADIGAGTGLFTALFAEQVGKQGHVFAVDIAPKFVEHLRDRAAAAALNRITVVLGQEKAITLPQDSVDIAFVCDVYHHFEYPQDSLASIYRALKPGGTFVVVDFERIPGQTRPWLLEHVRAGKDVVSQEIQAAGFQLVEEVSLDGLKDNYFLRFAKPSPGSPRAGKEGQLLPQGEAAEKRTPVIKSDMSMAEKVSAGLPEERWRSRLGCNRSNGLGY